MERSGSEAPVVDARFDQSYPASNQIAAVLSAKTAALYRLPAEDTLDLRQEALFELWRKAPAFDARRSCWRTFAERIVANRLASVMRNRRSVRSGWGKQIALAELEIADPVGHAQLDLQADVQRVLADVAPFDQKVAASLVNYSADETCHRLGVSRSTVYRAIGRLRIAFTEAGLSPGTPPRAIDGGSPA